MSALSQRSFVATLQAESVVTSALLKLADLTSSPTAGAEEGTSTAASTANTTLEAPVLQQVRCGESFCPLRFQDRLLLAPVETRHLETPKDLTYSQILYGLLLLAPVERQNLLKFNIPCNALQVLEKKALDLG